MPRFAVAGAGLQTAPSICSTPRGQPGQMPRSTASISYSFALVGILALLPMGRGFDLFRAASESPTDESETVGRRLAVGSCDTSCDGGCNWLTGTGCTSDCDNQCDSGCSDCPAGKVGSVGECNKEAGWEAGTAGPTAGQCCTCDQVYVRNAFPSLWTNPQSSKEGVYWRIFGLTKGSPRAEVTTPIYCKVSTYCLFHHWSGRWVIGLIGQVYADSPLAYFRSSLATQASTPNVCPKDVSNWDVYDAVADEWQSASFYLYVGCTPPSPSPPPPPPPSPHPPPPPSPQPPPPRSPSPPPTP